MRPNPLQLKYLKKLLPEISKHDCQNLQNGDKFCIKNLVSEKKVPIFVVIHTMEIPLYFDVRVCTFV